MTHQKVAKYSWKYSSDIMVKHTLFLKLLWWLMWQTEKGEFEINLILRMGSVQ